MVGKKTPMNNTSFTLLLLMFVKRKNLGVTYGSFLNRKTVKRYASPLLEIDQQKISIYVTVLIKTLRHN